MTSITQIYSTSNELIGFKVKGHANYSIPGRDIVCAAISAITINTINSIKDLSIGNLDFIEDAEGNVCYKIITKLDVVSCILLNSALIGYQSIAEEYSDNVVIIERR
ncbi:MAG: ribosomal-processing cysteine protease Prp [Anaerocolumna sp.]